MVALDLRKQHVKISHRRNSRGEQPTPLPCQQRSLGPPKPRSGSSEAARARVQLQILLRLLMATGLGRKKRHLRRLGRWNSWGLSWHLFVFCFYRPLKKKHVHGNGTPSKLAGSRVLAQSKSCSPPGNGTGNFLWGPGCRRAGNAGLCRASDNSNLLCRFVAIKPNSLLLGTKCKPCDIAVCVLELAIPFQPKTLALSRMLVGRLQDLDKSGRLFQH